MRVSRAECVRVMRYDCNMTIMSFHVGTGNPFEKQNKTRKLSVNLLLCLEFKYTVQVIWLTLILVVDIAKLMNLISTW